MLFSSTTKWFWEIAAILLSILSPPPRPSWVFTISCSRLVKWAIFELRMTFIPSWGRWRALEETASLCSDMKVWNYAVAVVWILDVHFWMIWWCGASSHILEFSKCFYVIIIIIIITSILSFSHGICGANSKRKEL